MPSVFPELTAGGLVVRDGAGNCLNPPAVERAYCPPAPFITTCEVTALPSDCTARIEPRQLNAIVSELVSFAKCLNPTGTWDCSSLENLCASFTAWATAALLNISPTIISDTEPPNPKQGTLWWESDTGNTYIWYDDGNTSQWIQIAPGSGGGAGGGGPVPLDAFVEITGDTMTGMLTLAANPFNAMHAATKEYVDNQVNALPLPGLPGQALVTNPVGVPQWGAPIDCGTF